MSPGRAVRYHPSMFRSKGQNPAPVLTPPDPLSASLVAAAQPLLVSLRQIIGGAILIGGVLGGLIGGLIMWLLSAVTS